MPRQPLIISVEMFHLCQLNHCLGTETTLVLRNSVMRNALVTSQRRACANYNEVSFTYKETVFLVIFHIRLHESTFLLHS